MAILNKFYKGYYLDTSVYDPETNTSINKSGFKTFMTNLYNEAQSQGVDSSAALLYDELNKSVIYISPSIDSSNPSAMEDPNATIYANGAVFLDKIEWVVTQLN